MLGFRGQLSRPLNRFLRFVGKQIKVHAARVDSWSMIRPQNEIQTYISVILAEKH
jgi:hypothetical protein